MPSGSGPETEVPRALSTMKMDCENVSADWDMLPTSIFLLFLLSKMLFATPKVSQIQPNPPNIIKHIWWHSQISNISKKNILKKTAWYLVTLACPGSWRKSNGVSGPSAGPGFHTKRFLASWRGFPPCKKHRQRMGTGWTIRYIIIIYIYIYINKYERYISW